MIKPLPNFKAVLLSFMFSYTPRKIPQEWLEIKI